MFWLADRSARYHQAHKPIQDQESVEGHSVRAMYLLTAVADLVRLDHLDNDHHLRQALIQLWENMTQRKMYVTGGIGAIEQWEVSKPVEYIPYLSHKSRPTPCFRALALTISCRKALTKAAATRKHARQSVL